MIPQYIPVFNRKKLAENINTYIMSDGYFSEYKKTIEFEDKLAKFLKVKYCFCVNNGTIALSLALLANGVKPGDWVIVPNITMFATQAAVQLIGAKPLFVDVEENSCMNLLQALELINSGGIKACIYVTLNGRKHNIKEYENFILSCMENKVKIIEDNAQSFGSKDNFNKYISNPTGGLGTFSFSHHKLITTGQGGCLVTNNDELANRIRRLKDFGCESIRDRHNYFGINSKFTDMQAIMGLNQLETINTRIKYKKENHHKYYQLLKDIPQVTFIPTNTTYTCPWFNDIYVENREKLQVYLLKEDIGTRIIYPELTCQEVNKNITVQKNYPVSAKIARTGLWLPSSLNLTLENIELICNKIKEFYEN